MLRRSHRRGAWAIRRHTLKDFVGEFDFNQWLSGNDWLGGREQTLHWRSVHGCSLSLALSFATPPSRWGVPDDFPNVSVRWYVSLWVGSTANLYLYTVNWELQSDKLPVLEYSTRMYKYQVLYNTRAHQSHARVSFCVSYPNRGKVRACTGTRTRTRRIWSLPAVEPRIFFGVSIRVNCIHRA